MTFATMKGDQLRDKKEREECRSCQIMKIPIMKTTCCLHKSFFFMNHDLYFCKLGQDTNAKIRKVLVFVSFKSKYSRDQIH